MTPDIKERGMKKVFRYMGWCQHNFDRFHKCKVCNKMANHSTLKIHCLDGNDMVLAINKMVEKKDWKEFYLWTIGKDNQQNEETSIGSYEVWLFGNPDNFFKLMEEWLNEKAD
jgi:hypothetical protein